MQMPLSRRTYRPGVELSIVGLGGMTVVGMDQSRVESLVAEALKSGVNYFDVSPYYGGGEAELKLGRALKPYRGEIFLAGKSLERTARGMADDLHRSLDRLQSAHLDLFQIHALNTRKEVEAIFAPGGAMEFFAGLRESGLARFLGFSAHSVEAALAVMGRFAFDSMLFPVNFVHTAHACAGESALKRARELGVARIALKSMALTRWAKSEKRDFPNCWYKPVADPDVAGLALRFALSTDVVSALPPGDEGLFRLALTAARDFTPLTEVERLRLLEAGSRARPPLKL
jgi:predicted aldo/keto reductase-like oxidoreductase